MKRWLHGGASYRLGNFTVAVAALGLPLAYAGVISGQPIVLAFGLGMMGVLPLTCGLQALAEWRFQRRFRNVPVNVTVFPGSDGERVAFVTKLDGSISSLEIPDGYNPDTDGGRWLIAQIAPEIADMLVPDEEDE